MSDALELVKRWLQRGNSALIGEQGSIVGVDIGSYGLRAIAADLHGTKVHTASRDLPSAGAEAITAEAVTLVRDLLRSSDMPMRQVVRIGIGFGGPVDADAGLTRVHYRRPGWENFPLVERFENAFDAPVLLDNDANVIALGEACCADHHDVRNLFYLHLSTGVGGGMVVDGRLYHGASSTAAEIGHTIVHRDGPICSCGGKGHLEAYVSVGALLSRLRALGVETDLLSDVFDGTPAARQVVAEATELLGLTLANVATVIDPQIIVVGGIVARTGGEQWLGQLSRNLQETLPPTLRRDITVAPSVYMHDSVAVGGLALALASLQE
jgi:glucokinase